jgi:hypothetical protein
MSIAAIMPAIARAFPLMLAIICYLVPAQPVLARMPEFSGGKLPTLAPLSRRASSTSQSAVGLRRAAGDSTRNALEPRHARRTTVCR